MKAEWKIISRIIDISNLIKISSFQLLTKKDNISLPILSSSMSIIQCLNPGIEKWYLFQAHSYNGTETVSIGKNVSKL